MKLGVISDIHGNSIALQAVLEDMPKVDDIISLGDVVGYGANPAKCVELIREHASTSLNGNHEEYLQDPQKCSHNAGAYKGILHAKDDLTEDQFEWATNRPQKTTIDGTFLITHGHPDEGTPFKYVRPSNVTNLIPYFDGHTLMATGHSHIQFKQDLGKFAGQGGVFFNPGSVGQPRDNNTKAAYAVVDTNTAEVDLHRVKYDIGAAQQLFKQANLPNISAQRLDKGK